MFYEFANLNHKNISILFSISFRNKNRFSDESPITRRPCSGSVHDRVKFYDRIKRKRR